MAFCLLNLSIAQEMGNATYGGKFKHNEVKAAVSYSNANSMTIEVSGIYNIKADGYIVIFATTQAGNTAEETDQLMNDQINLIKNEMKTKNISADIFVDMVSFVPLYEYELDKKRFNKRSYKEVPKGFEMRKNLHIRYKNPNELEKIITICAKAEVYDLVKVNHYSEKIEEFKDEMRTKAIAILNKKIKFNNEVVNINLNEKKRTMGEGFQIFYPNEQFSSYQAYSSNSLNFQQGNKVSTAQKSTTYYHNPVVPKSHDFIINADKLEPSMQMLYTISVTYDLRPEPKEKTPTANTSPATKKEYVLITADGQIKTLPIQ